jgi:hypothetical protein
MPQRTTTRVSRTSICAHVAEFEAIVAVQTNVQSFVKRAGARHFDLRERHDLTVVCTRLRG